MNNIQTIPREIELLQKAGEFLAECQSLDEVKKLRDKAEAIRFYQQKIDKSGQSAIIAAEIKVRAERRMGELLRNLPKQQPGEYKRFQGGTVSSLSDLGVGKTESHRCQAIAALPAEKFEETIEKAKKANRPPTSNEMKVEGQSHQRAEAKREALNGKAHDIEQPDAWEIRQGDCLEELAALQERSTRLVFADPPYNIGVDYGTHYNDRRPSDEYERWCADWMGQINRVLTRDGSFWLLVNWEWAHDLRGVARDEGEFHLRQTIVWYESFGVNTTRMFNRCSRALLWFTKDPKNFIFNDCPQVRRESDRQTKYNDSRANPEGKLWDDVWGIHEPIPRVVGTSKERLPNFPTQLPLALLRPVIACASNPGDLVIDPFSGSGTSGAACIELGRRFLGIELSEDFATLSRKRLLAISRNDKNAAN